MTLIRQRYDDENKLHKNRNIYRIIFTHIFTHSQFANKSIYYNTDANNNGRKMKLKECNNNTPSNRKNIHKIICNNMHKLPTIIKEWHKLFPFKFYNVNTTKNK